MRHSLQDGATDRGSPLALHSPNRKGTEVFCFLASQRQQVSNSLKNSSKLQISESRCASIFQNLFKCKGIIIGNEVFTQIVILAIPALQKKKKKI